MKPARAIGDRDPKPDNKIGPVAITWRAEVDSRRLRRLAEILADVLDNQTRSGGRSPR